jgi:hypothetical protein
MSQGLLCYKWLFLLYSCLNLIFKCRRKEDIGRIGSQATTQSPPQPIRHWYTKNAAVWKEADYMITRSLLCPVRCCCPLSCCRPEIQTVVHAEKNQTISHVQFADAVAVDRSGRGSVCFRFCQLFVAATVAGPG